MSGQPETAKVRVAEPKTATAEETKDYRFLLEENLQLLREADKVKSAALAEAKKAEALQKELNEMKAIAASRTVKGYKLGRRIVLGAHVVLSIIVGFSGLTLWLKGFAPAASCWTAAPGILWLGIITAVIYDLADNE